MHPMPMMMDAATLMAFVKPLRRQINLVAIREDGTYQRIYEKWFGRE